MDDRCTRRLWRGGRTISFFSDEMTWGNGTSDPETESYEVWVSHHCYSYIRKDQFFFSPVFHVFSEAFSFAAFGHRFLGGFFQAASEETSSHRDGGLRAQRRGRETFGNVQRSESQPDWSTLTRKSPDFLLQQKYGSGCFGWKKHL